jgi:hypothetical protein
MITESVSQILYKSDWSLWIGNQKLVPGREAEANQTRCSEISRVRSVLQHPESSRPLIIKQTCVRDLSFPHKSFGVQSQEDIRSTRRVTGYAA